MIVKSCGHTLVVRRVYDAGDGNRETWDVCNACKIKPFFSSFVIKETKIVEAAQ